MNRPEFTVRKCRRKKDKGYFWLRQKGELIAYLKPQPEHDRLIVYVEKGTIALKSEKQLELKEAGEGIGQMNIFGRVIAAFRRHLF